jgi:hypothetical protein
LKTFSLSGRWSVIVATPSAISRRIVGSLTAAAPQARDRARS